MKLPQGWYAIALSNDVKKKPVGLKRFAQKLVLFRTSSDELVVQEDRCPHRSTALSIGRVVNDAIECPFHGFRFDKSGACIDAPEFRRAIHKLCVKTYSSYESNGIVWMWYGESTPFPEKPSWFDEINHFSVSGFREIWPCHISRCVENQLDYAHLPFVHKRSIGRFATIGQKPESILDNEKIRFSFPKHSKNNSYIEFRYPNFWINFIAPRFAITLIFVPIDEEHTELILRSHQNFIKIPIISELVGYFLTRMNKKILAEDRRVVVPQTPKKSTEATDEHLFSNDLLIRHYRNYWNK